MSLLTAVDFQLPAAAVHDVERQEKPSPAQNGLWSELAEAYRQEIQEYSWLLHLINSESVHGDSEGVEMCEMVLSIGDQLKVVMTRKREREDLQTMLLGLLGVDPKKVSEVDIYEYAPEHITPLFQALEEEVAEMSQQLKNRV